MGKTANYGYYSKVLNKPFDTLAELTEAEAEFEKANAAEEQAKAAKKARAEAVQKAYADYLAAYEAAEKRIKEVSKEENDKVSAAFAAYKDLKSEFIKDYERFHMTYTDNNGEQTITVTDLLTEFMNSIPQIYHW